MSLGSLADNLARITEEYRPPTPPVITCPVCGGKIEAWLPDPGEEAKRWTLRGRLGPYAPDENDPKSG